MNGTPKPTFVELTIVDDGGTTLTPRKGLVDVALIAGLEDLGERTPLATRCAVTLHQPDDAVVENDTGENVVRASRTLLVRESYADLVGLLSEHVTVIRPR
jgi:hypothetical protein